MRASKVVILLASYNGEKYISEQIASFQAQSYQDWQLIVRDDNSNDNTVNIVRENASKDDRILLLEHQEVSLGVIGNFEELMKAALNLPTAEYIFFSDQDDVWRSDKLQVMLDKFNEVESLFGKGEAILTHSDLEVVDQNLKTINTSFMKYQAIKHEKVDAWKILAVQNFVTGCAMAANRTLLEQCLPFPKDIVVHDWWIALCASAIGQIRFINRPLLKYRQHNNNVVGAKGYWTTINPFRVNPRTRWAEGTRHFKLAVGQVEKLLEKLCMGIQHKYKNNISCIEMIEALEKFSSLSDLSVLQRVNTLWKYKFCRQNKVGNILLYCRVIVMYKSK